MSETRSQQASELAGRKILLIGAGSGIGRAIALLAASRGASLAVSVLDAAEAVPLEAAIPGIIALPLDLCRREQVGLVLGQLINRLGGLDAVVYSAGVMARTPAEAMSDADWDRLIEINLTGCFRVLRETLPALRKSASGPAAVVVSSQLGIVGFRAGAAYAASKSGLNGLMRSLALEYAPLGLRVNAVGPGPTETPMTERSRADPAIFAEMVSSIPMGRYGQPQEIAEVALFLASQRASFVTGQLWCVDGGYVAR
ncbi:SDR family NAD(P)-dependent oxidoreductase [Belnapia rosea]|uniref:SDR family NAD(P)-dependent oxidoreductase n=1 Tax=Belnapia rosea TaxID=938405 RepID=UPI000881F678|nr:SDR family NAD(P)-dependent oxidoreductase [Belnapia rosea]SDB74075.1 Enoyl-(Acyl carrier protein) reductase [Belnapia rosea]